MGFDRLIALENFSGCPNQHGKEVEVCTDNTASHMNLYFRGNGSRGYACMSPADAQRLRDALIEAYPLTAAKAGKKRPKGAQEYKGNGKHKWEFVTECAETGFITERLRVPGGWRYRDRSDEQCASGVFVPVPEAVGYVV